MFSITKTRILINNHQTQEKTVDILWDSNFNPWSIITFQDLHTFKAATGRQPKRLLLPVEIKPERPTLLPHKSTHQPLCVHIVSIWWREDCHTAFLPVEGTLALWRKLIRKTYFLPARLDLCLFPYIHLGYRKCRIDITSQPSALHTDVNKYKCTRHVRSWSAQPALCPTAHYFFT